MVALSLGGNGKKDAASRSLIQGTIVSGVSVSSGPALATCLVDGSVTPINVNCGAYTPQVGDRVALQKVGQQYLAFLVNTVTFASLGISFGATPWLALSSLYISGVSDDTTGYGPGAFRLVGDRVEMRGMIKNSATTTNATTLFTLNATYVPPITLRFSVIDNTAIWNWDILGATSSAPGAFRYSSTSTLAANTSMPLNGITYSIMS